MRHHEIPPAAIAARSASAGARLASGGRAVGFHMAHLADPLLRRVVWAVVPWTGAAWAGRSGLFPGQQAVARGEPASVAWARKAAHGLLEVVTESLAVARGAAALVAGHLAPLRSGPLGDVWGWCVRHMVVVRWVPSHRPQSIPQRGWLFWTGWGTSSLTGPPPRRRAAPPRRRGQLSGGCRS